MEHINLPEKEKQIIREAVKNISRRKGNEYAPNTTEIQTEIGIIVAKTPACNHKLMNKELGYLAWHEWAEKKAKRGAKQTQCPKCHLWLFRSEN